MEVLAQVISVDLIQDQSSKIKAKVKMLLDKPFDGLELKLFEHHQKQGIIGRFNTLQGKKCLVPLQVEKYNGEIQLNIPYGELPEAMIEVDTTTGEIPLKTVNPKTKAS